MADTSTYVGKHLLAGLTYVDADGQVVGKLQVHGVISRITEEGIFFLQTNGEEFSLPPDLDSLSAAGPGNYTLRATGEVVVDPDFVSSWTINAPPAVGGK
jgi:hypothetical protein